MNKNHIFLLIAPLYFLGFLAAAEDISHGTYHDTYEPAIKREPEHKPFVVACCAPECVDVLESPAAYKEHLRVIHGLRFACPHADCLFATLTKSLLVPHIKNHISAHEYACQEAFCREKTQGKLSDFHTHLKERHNKKIICNHPGCTFASTNRSAVSIHEKRHFEIRATTSAFKSAISYRCIWCSQLFYSTPAFTRHRRECQFNPENGDHLIMLLDAAEWIDDATTLEDEVIEIDK